MLTHNQPMGKYCSFRTGGIAQDFFTPENLDDLSKFLKNNEKRMLMLGLGSNLLVRDKVLMGLLLNSNTSTS